MSKKELIPESLVELLNYRVNQEETASRLYYAMQEWLDDKGYFGAARMLREWADEEMRHANWAREFLEAYGFLPEVKPIGSVKTEYVSLKDVIAKAHRHEIEITNQCNDLTEAVVKANCYCVMPLALKYMHEQTDELGKTTKWLDRLDLVGDDPREMMMIDREMGGDDMPINAVKADY
jgi:ferritin